MTQWKMLLGGSAIVAISALTGCGKNKLVEATEQYADKICACKDLDCTKKESEAYGKVLETHKDAKGTDDDIKAMEAAGKKALDCTTKLASAAMKDAEKGAGGGAEKKEEKKE